MYISLHNRSAYSFGSSLTRAEQLAGFAARHGIPAIAITDWCGLYGAVSFQQACEKAGVRPILGAELPVDAAPVFNRREDGSETPATIPLTLLAMTLRGYGNLCRLITRQRSVDRPLTVDELDGAAEGLIGLVGREARGGILAPAESLTHGRGAERPVRSPAATMVLLREVFGGRLYVELAIHRAEDVPVARRRARVADELGIPVVATPESRCLRREQARTLRALTSIGTLTLLDASHPDKPEGCWHLRTPEEMERLFGRRPDALTSTRVIAEQCDVRLDLTRSRFPAFTPPDGRTTMQYLRDLCVAGCRRRYVEQPAQKGMGGYRPTLKEALRRLDRELGIIEQVHYAEYFLVFHEIVQYCRSQGIATLARGSAADSLVCYALGVSHACPFRFDLPFDRFVNPERARFSKMADIDLDLPWDRRDQVIRWVYERWGNDRVAMIGAPNMFHARAAVAELGKVFGLPAHEVHRATRLLPHASAWHLSEAIAASPEAREFPVQEEPYRTILAMASELEGLPRHWSMHPCGLIVSPEPMTDLVPVQPSPKGPLVAQYDMDVVEELGFVKIDLLGQAGLSVLRDAVDEIWRTTGERVDLETDVDYSDQATWDLIAGGQARGVHHIESPAMTSLIGECNCRDIDCLTTIVAIIRPGAANQGKKEAFARRYQGYEPPAYPHPALIPVLEKTYGLMVFEEHILQIAVEFAGMNLGRADVLRRALNKEKRDLIAEMREEFWASARVIGRSKVEIEAVWAAIEGFFGFMFNKAHSAEYAVEAFQGAWLKRRWPAHYLAAILSNYRGFYAHSPTLPQILYVLEALRLGIGVLPPCVSRSRPHFSVEAQESRIENGELRKRPVSADDPVQRNLSQFSIRNSQFIRIPVSHIQGLSAVFAQRWWDQRQRGAFGSLEEFVDRCRPGESEAQSLLDCGALDVFGESRPAMFWQLRRLLRRSPGAGLLRGQDVCESLPVTLTEPSRRQVAQREMDLLGFPVTTDPLAHLGSDESGRTIDWSRYVPVRELGGYAGRRVEVCGLMVTDRVNATPGGELMKFVTLADRTGFVETILFPDVYRRSGHLTIAHPIVAATGTVERFENGTGFTLRAHRLRPPAMRAAVGITPSSPGEAIL